jgi:hypothetical protein
MNNRPTGVHCSGTSSDPKNMNMNIHMVLTFWKNIFPPFSGMKKDGGSTFPRNVDTYPHGVTTQKTNNNILIAVRSS